MLDFIKSNKFTFIVNGFHFENTVVEAILISPLIYESLRQDPSVSTFCISSSEIDSNDFIEFVQLFHLNINFDSTILVLSLLSIFRALGNESLSISLLTLIHSQLDESQSSFNSKLDQSRIPFWRESLNIDVNIDYCASKFGFYSTAELCCLNQHLLHALLSSSSLHLENENVLLTRLLELGEDYSEMLNYLEIAFLSDEGISQFVEHFPFSRLTSDIWSKIVIRLKSIPDEELCHHCYHFHIFDLQQQKVHQCKSTIFSTFPTFLNDITNKTLRLLYRGSRDGFNSSSFHNKCDGESNTITFIQTTKDFLFGRFTPVCWDSSN
jgi:hypothetical protein